LIHVTIKDRLKCWAAEVKGYQTQRNFNYLRGLINVCMSLVDTSYGFLIIEVIVTMLTDR